MLKCFNLETKPNDVINLTDDIKQFVAESGIQSGECIVFNPHTTAGLTITSFWIRLALRICRTRSAA